MSKNFDAGSLQPTLMETVGKTVSRVERFLEGSRSFESREVLDLFNQINDLQIKRAYECKIPQAKSPPFFALHEGDRQLAMVKKELVIHLRRKMPRATAIFGQVIRGEKLGKNDEQLLEDYRNAVESYRGDEIKFSYPN